VTVPSAAVVEGHEPSAYIESKIYQGCQTRTSRRHMKAYGIRCTKSRKRRADDCNEAGAEVVVSKEMDARHLNETEDTCM
jgi:hypothetical protein